ncbi:O-antigen ligase family protein [Natronorarus salvus]|uniref:O-antigen ligase family protein n=1 Tax=Natronorarus salvus TaxID=3117733 RepID=UPI002F26B812
MSQQADRSTGLAGAYVGREPESGARSPLGLMVGLPFAVFLGAVVLSDTTAGGWFTSRRLALFALAFLAVLFADRWLAGERTEVETGLLLGRFALLVGLLVVVHYGRSGVIDGGSSLAFAGVLLALIALSLAHPTARDRPLELASVGLFAVVLGIYFSHASALDPATASARFPLWAGIVAASCLFVVPRHLPEDWTLAAIAALATPVSALGLSTLVLGAYDLGPFAVQPWSATVPVPLVGELQSTRSLFENPNTFGLLAFAGTAAAAVGTVRAWPTDRALSIGFGFLALVNLGGLVLSNSRASIAAFAVFAVVYAVALVGGRRTYPLAILATLVGAVGVLLAISLGLIDSAGRLELWSAGLAVVADAPSALGYGIVGTGATIEPYLAERSGSVHNSYLSTAIRVGVVGGLAYLALVVAPLLYAAVRSANVSAAALALASAWAVHQLFEVYSLIQVSTPGVLAALALGYLLVGSAEPGDR